MTDFSGTNEQLRSCNCVGPQPSFPKCPCLMQGLEQRDGRWVEPEKDLGPVAVMPLPEGIQVSRDLMVAQARIQKLEQELQWFARGKFIGETGHDMAERIIRRARGAIKYLADE